MRSGNIYGERNSVSQPVMIKSLTFVQLASIEDIDQVMEFEEIINWNCCKQPRASWKGHVNRCQVNENIGETRLINNSSRHPLAEGRYVVSIKINVRLQTFFVSMNGFHLFVCSIWWNKLIAGIPEIKWVDTISIP